MYLKKETFIKRKWISKFITLLINWADFIQYFMRQITNE